ncbi:DUF3536 domain-containing protein [bacterium]|nr:DUF3536 domain-containing protein [bacterium]MBU3954937.1 DUF3536 domain-containing protein [bacterium]
MAERYVIVHGHFYQPPRANPWLGNVLRQNSAEPYHDWNERIFNECYLPNSGARIQNENGYTIDMVNNFELISFNFGPTLGGWVRHRHAATWDIVKKGDSLSRERLGHGNAIACAFSHTILPLSPDFVRKTDILWGLKSFERDFGRKAEAIWLPETAVNNIVIDELIELGMKYVLLVPTQIESANPEDIKHKIDVSAGVIDPRYPYKIIGEKGSINVLIAHHEISHAVSFERLFSDSRAAANRIEGAFSENTHHDQIITVLCDGETFGHHQPFAERGLAHLLKYELPARGIKVVNPAYICEKVPPHWELKIKDGNVNEGTSWSCAHGLGRWKTDCGCGKESGQSQQWREPLRDAFNFVSSELCSYFTEEIKKYTAQPDDALKNYPAVLYNFSSTDAFIAQFFGEDTSFEAKKKILLLFEMLKQTLFSFTSCGWFWSEISGIEPVQNMAYACRAIELYKKLSGKDIKEDFLKLLEKAPSNIKELSNGKIIFEKYIIPQEESRHKFAAGLIIQMVSSGLRKTVSKEGQYYHVFIDPAAQTLEYYEKNLEETSIYKYEVKTEDIPFSIKLSLDGKEKDYSLDNIFKESRHRIMARFWMNKIIELKDTYNSLLDHFLEFEGAFNFFKKPVKEIEPLIAKVLMFQLMEIEQLHNMKRIQVVRSLVDLIKEHRLGIDGFYTAECLHRSLDKELGRFTLGNFANLEFLTVLFDIYFMLKDKIKENTYHNMIFKFIKENENKIASAPQEQKQHILAICIRFGIDPDIIK